MSDPRKFTPPWSVAEIDGGFTVNVFTVNDANGIVLAYIYARDDMAARGGGNVWLTTEEAWRIATGIAKLPGLLKRDQGGCERLSASCAR